MSSRNLMMEISDLALKASENQLNVAQLKRLNELLEASDEARRTLLYCGILDAQLADMARDEAAQELAMEDSISDVPFMNRTTRAVVTSRVKRRFVKSWVFRGVAACLVLCAVFAIYSIRKSPPITYLAKRVPQPVGSLKSAVDAKFIGDMPTAGDAFMEGQIIMLESGEAHVSMACGAEFVLKGPAELEFDNAKHVQLRRGLLTAHVAAWGSGFTVDTRAMRVVDLGTQFAISASSDDVETHVLQGQVRVQPLESKLNGRRSVLLTQGEAIRMDSGAFQPVLIAAEKDRFPPSSEKFHPFKPIALANTGTGLSEGDEDSYWRITAGPAGGSFTKPQFAVVCRPDVRYATNEPQRSQWLSFARDVRPGGMPKSVFTFETTFDLTGFDPSTVMVAAQVLADNGVRAMRINGQSVPIIPWDDNVPMQTFNSDQFRLVEIREGFVPGKNKLEIDVWNGTYRTESMHRDPNPTALRVEFQAYGRLENKREAAATAKSSSERL